MEWIVFNSEQDTREFGQRLGRLLFSGAVVALVGPLGAGKTYLVRAIAEGLEIVNPDLVSSPTFVLVQEYAARLPIFHFDAYRLASEAEFADLGVQEYYEAGGVCLIEWADKVRGVLPAEYLEINLRPMGETARRMEIEAHGERYQKLERILF
jgi:tRNA threonylcarbamoyladenosine biosynthesis protein TsaE